MKRIVTISLYVLLSSAFLPLTSCTDLHKGIELPTGSHSVDIDHFASQCFYETTDSQNLTLQVNSPFATTVLSTDDVIVDNSARERGSFILMPGRIPENMMQTTRDIAVHIRPFEMQNIEGFDAFCYPVRIRQRGEDGTLYLTPEQISAWKQDHSTFSSWKGNYNQHYVLGTVKSVSPLHSEAGIPDEKSYLGKLWFVPALERSFDSAQDIEAVDIVLQVGSEDLSVKIHYPACYHLVKNMLLPVGSTVEMNVPNSGMIAGDNTLWVSPLDILIR